VTLGLILSNGFPVPAPFVIGYSGLMQMLLTGQGNTILPPDRQITSARALFVQDFPIDWARNRCCQLFLDNDDGDYLLFLDADMRHPALLPQRLIAHGVDIVSARYVTRRQPFFTVAMRKVGPGPWDYQAVEKVVDKVEGLIPVDAAGAGALLISRRALIAMRDRRGANEWFRYQDGPDGLRSRSEDMWFYEQAIEAGFQPYLDADTVCTHFSTFEVDPSFQRPFFEAMERAQADAVEGTPV
jgi:hypothetical protein